MVPTGCLRLLGCTRLMRFAGGPRPAPTVGYRVLSVQPESPAADVSVIHNGVRKLDREERMHGSLISFFDWIISINGHRLVSCPAATYRPPPYRSHSTSPSRMKITTFSSRKSNAKSIIL